MLQRLKDLIVEKTDGTIEVFLSSDGQSIPLGRNWVHRVQEALDEATIMVVFITPNSLRSSWIYLDLGTQYLIMLYFNNDKTSKSRITRLSAPFLQ